MCECEGVCVFVCVSVRVYRLLKMVNGLPLILLYFYRQ